MRSIAMALALGFAAALVGQTAARCEEIKSTAEFRLLCNGFHQDIGLRDSTLEKIVEEGICIMIGRVAETEALRMFLNDVLIGRYSSDEINKLWSTCPADIYVSGPQGGFELLRAVRRRLDQPPFLGGK